MADEVEAVHASITVDAVCKALDSLGVSDRKASTAATEEPAACSRPRKSFGGVLGQTSVIRPFLLLGGKWSAGDVNRLRQHNVTHIVNVTAQIPNSFPSEFAYLNIRIPDADTVDISRHFEPACAFISACRDRQGTVLVHCSAGMSRSVTIVLAFLMRAESMSLIAALELVKSKRHMVSPNAGFMRQLVELELKLYGTTSIDLSAYEQNRWLKVGQLVPPSQYSDSQHE